MSSKWIARQAFFLTALGGLTLSVAAAPKPKFDVVDLGTLPGGHHTQPSKINNNGQVVGRTTDADGYTLPFLYTEGAITAIRWEGGEGVALQVNDSGAVVGQIGTRAFLYRDGSVVDLSPWVGSDWVAATGINSAGQIVGYSGPVSNVFNVYPAFLLEGTVVHFFEMLPGGYSSQANDINDAGQAVGACAYYTGESREQETHAVLFQNGTVADLGTLAGGRHSAAHAISENGLIAGWSHTPAGNRAFLYRDGRMSDLGVLAGDVSCVANDVNSAGWVVGRSEGPLEQSRAFLHTGRRLHDLNDLIRRNSGWRLETANGINEQGQIVGWGYRQGEFRAFLLTPERR